MSAPAFYIGAVSHARATPVAHRLRYRIAYVLLDLDRAAEADRASRLVGVDRPALLSVRARDHGPLDAPPQDMAALAAWVRTLLRARGVEETAGRIELLTLPRMLGFVFNPISVYFIRDAEGALHHVLYEVSNTFGERAVYLCAAGAAEGGAHRHGCAKTLYVSPFFGVEGDYRFRVASPDESLALAIRYYDAEGRPALNATLAGRRAPLNDASALKIVFGLPLMTLGVIAAIHWEALKLFLKGAGYRPRRRPHAPRATHRPTGGTA